MDNLRSVLFCEWEAQINSPFLQQHIIMERIGQGIYLVSYREGIQPYEA